MLLINKARYWLNSVFGAAHSFSSPNAAPSIERIREVSHKTLNSLFELITKQRKDIEVINTCSYKWNLIRPEHIIFSDVPDSQLDTLVPLHDCVKLTT